MALSMGEMTMPDGSAMSMMWMPMPGQTWAGAAASFVGMWVVMMVPMMLPSLTPMLWRYRQVLAGTVDTPSGWLTAVCAPPRNVKLFMMCYLQSEITPRRTRSSLG